MGDPSASESDVPEHASKMALWKEFCRAHHIARDSVPLFATSRDGAAEITRIGRSATPMLRRSEPMDARIGGAVADILRARPEDLEGLLYLMLRLDMNGEVVPLYIGRAGRHGKNGTVVSANLKSISQTATGGWTNSGKFARWGYGYAYQMGDLSCAVRAGHEPRRPTPKYPRWAKKLFFKILASAPRTRFEVRFWCIPWRPASPGISQEFGACPLALIEYLLIGVASLLFPDDLLNEEGVNLRDPELI